ncbi:GrpB family protein [Aporhodopirellula aestuarii]|uniref:GrpB family protein n=1 Tax=Aporhodopirellula aestuarii TaxID=2950107 RepID=A0ABT0U1X4_9BACT|nr:GrpB family protein [Aporhodopirellula aestuarii]MCM2370889.1 GrpB family protein [Aporhodopirellula aestuarii]
MTQPHWRGTDFNDDGEPGRVRLMHHDARWRQEFEQTRSSILQCCEGRVVAVEHIGSTAISGIIARPIVDAIAVVADPVDLSESAELIEGLNFLRVEMPEWAKLGGGGQVALQKPRHGEITHRIYAVTQGSPLLRQTTRLRDYLRSNPDVAISFEEAKVEAWRDCEGDPDAYADAMAVVFADLYPPA